MYAVVKTGGKQHRVEVGETLSVELLDAEPGAVVNLTALLVADGESIVTGADAADATVTAEVLGHGKADKVVVFKFKKRKGYKRTRGHRQDLTLVKITDIASAGGSKPAKKAAAAKAAPVEADAAPAKKAPAKKAAAAEAPAAAPAKKAAPKKAATGEAKPAAKKPAAPKAAAAEGDAPAKKPAAKKPAAKKTAKPTESAE